jgi:hypothetical protein
VQLGSLFLQEEEMDTSRAAQIVEQQMRAAKIQASCKWMIPQNFFANMIGHMALAYDLETATAIVDIFEKTSEHHEAMMQDMIDNPGVLRKAINEVVDRRFPQEGAA